MRHREFWKKLTVSVVAAAMIVSTLETPLNVSAASENPEVVSYAEQEDAVSEVVEDIPVAETVNDSSEIPEAEPEHECVWDDGVITKKATCTTDGEITYTCTDETCGKTKKEVIKATGHDWPATGTVTKQATFTATGVMTYTCKNCGTKKTAVIPKLTKVATPVLTGIEANSSGVVVSWNKVTDGVIYRVFRKKTDGGSWVKLTDTTELKYTDKTAVTGTQYAYTVRCVNPSNGSFASDYDRTGRIIRVVPAPVLSAIANVTSGVKITWKASKNAEKYRVFRKEGTGSWKGVGYTTATSFTDTTAVDGKTYTYTVRCTNKEENAYTSTYDSAGLRITYVAAPHITSITNEVGGVKLSWKESDAAEKYKIFRKTADTGYVAVGTTGKNTFTDTSVSSGNTYYYYVRCINSAGTEYTSSYIDKDAQILYIAAPKLLSISQDNVSVTLKWQASAGAEAYQVFRKCGDGDWVEVYFTRTCQYVDETIESGKTYTYTVCCMNKAGNVYTSAFNANGLTAGYIEQPELKSAVPTEKGVTVSWNASPGAEKYMVFRKSGNTGWQSIGIVSTTSYTDTTVKSGTAYVYTVRCVAGANNNYTSTFDSKGLSVTYVTQPVLSKCVNTASGVTVSWNASVGVQKYAVYRKTGSQSWKRLGLTTATSYTDKTAVGGTLYYYTVRCVNTAGTVFTSSYDSPGLKIRYIAAPKLSSVTNGSTGVTVKWNSSPGAEKYRVYRKTGNGKWTKLADTTANSYVDKTAKSGTTYSYTVGCMNAAGTTATGAYNTTGLSIKYIAQPGLPTLKNSKKGVVVSWKKVTGAAKYRVFRKTAGGSWTKVADTTGLSVTDTKAKNGTTYIYTIRCISSDGKSFTSSYNSTGKSIKCKK